MGARGRPIRYWPMGSGLIAQGRRPWIFDDQRLRLLTDGTANPEILRQFVPQFEDLPEIRVQRNARVIQVRDLTFFRHSLVERAPAGEEGARWRPTARLAAVARFMRVAKEGRTLVVTNKRVRCALTGESLGVRLLASARYAGADIAHFGNIRGTNEFEDHDFVIILGREADRQGCRTPGHGDLVRHEGTDPLRSRRPEGAGAISLSPAPPHYARRQPAAGEGPRSSRSTRPGGGRASSRGRDGSGH